MYSRLTSATKPFVKPLHYRGLNGRVLRLPARGKKTQNIVFVYGIHGSLERFYGVVMYLSRFGNVTMPDLPGFGGMEPFYNINIKPSLDANADFLAEFIENEFDGKSVRVVALSYGFAVVTRMLQRHPKLASQTTLLVSLMGITEGSQIAVRGLRRAGVKLLLWVARTWPLGYLLQFMNTRTWILKRTYNENHPKMRSIAPEDRSEFIEFERHLWSCNDIRTYGACMLELFALCQPADPLPLTVHHVGTKHDHLLNSDAVAQGLAKSYSDVEIYWSELQNHGGTAYDSEEESRVMIPRAITELLERTS